ncbi:hypothetical protein CVIRNUC_007709 [Coccomyxa viridis]|uniref:Single-stranded DNA-binding protein n=1 Tax=Coccomyxa viridis TaxID=1274662 RepID=A0AAV1IET7_9CHLO|nr:hypothetical protein CVIRNUC_007709 [Coccomyxa viridis]
MVTDTTLDSAACWQHMPQLPHQPCYQLPSADDVCLELSRQEGKLQALVCRSTCSSAGPSLKSVKLLQTASSRLHMLLKMAASFACTVSRSRTVAAGPQAFTHRMPAPPQARLCSIRQRSIARNFALQAAPSAAVEEETQSFSSYPEPEIREVDFDPRLVNSVGLLGRLGTPFQLRRIGDRMAVATSALAVTRGSKKEGQEQQTDWFTLEVWNKLAELATENLDKGMQIQVVGRLKTETWTDKATNQPRKSFKVVADQVNRVRSFGQGYGEVQRMQAPQPDMWEAQPAPAAQPAQRAPPQQPPQPPGDDFVGGAPQSFFGEMPPRGADVGPSEKKWMEFFSNPSAYWDNRQNKRNPRAPDFKHKDDKDSVLWLDSRDTPPWVGAQLQNAGLGNDDDDQIPF